MYLRRGQPMLSWPTPSMTVTGFWSTKPRTRSRRGWREHWACLHPQCHASATSSTAASPWRAAGSSWTRSLHPRTRLTARFRWHAWSTGTRAWQAGGGSQLSLIAALSATCRSRGCRPVRIMRSTSGGVLPAKPRSQTGWRPACPISFAGILHTFGAAGLTLPPPRGAVRTWTPGTPARLGGPPSSRGSDVESLRPDMSGCRPHGQWRRLESPATSMQLRPPALRRRGRFQFHQRLASEPPLDRGLPHWMPLAGWGAAASATAGAAALRRRNGTTHEGALGRRAVLAQDAPPAQQHCAAQSHGPTDRRQRVVQRHSEAVLAAS